MGQGWRKRGAKRLSPDPAGVRVTVGTGWGGEWDQCVGCSAKPFSGHPAGVRVSPARGGCLTPPPSPSHHPHPASGGPRFIPPSRKIPVRRKVLTCREEEEGEEEAAAVAHGTGGGGSRGGRDAPPGPVARPLPPRSGPHRCRRPPRSSAGRTAAPAGTGDRRYRASAVVSGTGHLGSPYWARALGLGGGTGGTHAVCLGMRRWVANTGTGC